MKKFSLLLLIAFAFGIFGFMYESPTSSETEGMTFFKGTFQEALELAKKEKKLIFLDAYASWCGPCKLMKSKTFTDPEVGNLYNAKFINLAIDMEKGEGPELSRKYQVTAYPTLLFIDAKGKVVHRALGYHQPKEFMGLVKQIP